MRVVLFRHPSVGVPELVGDDSHGNAAQRQAAGVSVAQDVEADGGFDLGCLGSRDHRPALLGPLPWFATRLVEDQLATASPGRRARGVVG